MFYDSGRVEKPPCAGCQSKAHFGLRSSHKGCDNLVIIDDHLLSLFGIPMILRSSDKEAGELIWIQSLQILHAAGLRHYPFIHHFCDYFFNYSTYPLLLL